LAGSSAVARRQREHLAVDGDTAAACGDVDDAQLAPHQEGLAHRGGGFGLARQFQCGVHRGRAADHEAFVVAVIERQAISLEQAFQQVAFAQLVIAGASHHVGMGGVIALVKHSHSPYLLSITSICLDGGLDVCQFHINSLSFFITHDVEV
jgi:hypothetical protein